MLIHIYEYVTAALAPGEADPGMEREGAAMLRALAGDFAALSHLGVEAIPLIHEDRIIPDLASQPIVVRRGEPFPRLVQRLDPRGSWFVVAPESDSTLTTINACLQRMGRELLSPSGEWVGIASDKAKIGQMLADWMPQQLSEAEFVADEPPWSGDARVVIKPRDGCGSMHVGLVAWQHRRELMEAIRAAGYAGPVVMERFIEGEAMSAAVIGNGRGGYVVLPAARQIITVQDQGPYAWLSYHGGEIGPHTAQAVPHAMLADILALMGPFRGYFGMDLVVEPDGNVRLIEINPRLTTSYVGYSRWMREATGRDDAMGRLMLGEELELPTVDKIYRFFPDGRFAD